MKCHYSLTIKHFHLCILYKLPESNDVKFLKLVSSHVMIRRSTDASITQVTQQRVLNSTFRIFINITYKKHIFYNENILYKHVSSFY